MEGNGKLTFASPFFLICVVCVCVFNRYKPGDTALCGQKLVDSNINKCWDLVLSKCDFNSRVADAEAFNAKNTFLKKGIALVPGKYIMNGCRNYPAFVEILEDGAVLVQHAGCEIGQGIHTKAIQAAALELAIDPAIVQCRCEPTNQRATEAASQPMELPLASL